MCPGAPLLDKGTLAVLKGRVSQLTGVCPLGKGSGAMPQRKLGAVTGGLAGEPTLVVGPEVLGRKIMVFVKAANDFVSGTIVGFDTKGESHNIRWEGRSSGKRSEDTLRLAAEHWYLEGPRPPKEKPNPHFAALPPKGELVGRRIKHFWPKMGRWYRGTVVSYDAKKDTHHVKYADKDKLDISVRHEAVILASDYEAPPTTTRKKRKDPFILRSKPGSSKRIRADRQAPAVSGTGAKAVAKPSNGKAEKGKSTDMKTVAKPARQDAAATSAAAKTAPAAASQPVIAPRPRTLSSLRSKPKACVRLDEAFVHPPIASLRSPAALPAGQGVGGVAGKAAGGPAGKAGGTHAAAKQKGPIASSAAAAPGKGGAAGSAGAPSKSSRPTSAKGNPPKKSASATTGVAANSSGRNSAATGSRGGAADAGAAAAATSAAQSRAARTVQRAGNAAAAATAAASADRRRPASQTPPTIPQPTRKHVLVSSIPGTEAVPKPPAPAAARRTRLAPASGGQRRGVGGARGASRGRSIRRSGFDEFASDLEDESSASDGEEFEMELALASDGEDEFAATASEDEDEEDSFSVVSSGDEHASEEGSGAEEDPEDGEASGQDDIALEDVEMAASEGGGGPADPGGDESGSEVGMDRTPAGSPRPATRPQTPKVRPASSPAVGGAGQSLERDREDDQRDSDKRSKLGGARPSATPRGAGRRNPRLPVHAAGNDALVGARLGVQAVVDDAIHRAEVVWYNAYHKTAKLRFDDGYEETVSLRKERIRLLTPRAASGGCTAAMAALMADLGAEGVVLPTPEPLVGGVLPAAHPAHDARHAFPDGGRGTPAGARDGDPPRANGAVGCRLSLYCPADGKWYRADVLAYDRSRGAHHVLYEDGEDEWLKLPAEVVSWQRGAPGGTLGAGLSVGEDVPAGPAAVGWRIGVYWNNDTLFYYGDIIQHEPHTNRHQVLYDDGERAFEVLPAETVKWVLRPRQERTVNGVRLPWLPAAARRRAAVEEAEMQNGTTPKSPAALRPSMALALARSPAATADADIADGVAPAAELGSHWAGLNRLVHQTHLTLKLPPRPPGGLALLSAPILARPPTPPAGDPVVVRQMRRLRKGRAHAGVMGGDATPTSGAVTVRIYCSATQQRLKAEQAFEAAQSSAVSWQPSIELPPSSAAAGPGHGDRAADFSAWGAWGPSSSAVEHRQGPAADDDVMSGADPADAAAALQRRKAELDAMLERVTRAEQAMASRQQQVAAEQQRQRWPQQHQPQQQQEPSSPDWATTVTATPRSPTTATTAMTWGASFGGATPLAGVTPQSLAAQGSRGFGGHGPNAFAAFVGRPRLPGAAPSSARTGDAVPGPFSVGVGGTAMGAAAAHTSPAVAHALALATANPATAATPLVAPLQPAPAAAPGVVDCPTIGPEIRAAARTPPGSPVGAGTLAAAAAAALHHGESAELPAELALADGGEGEDVSDKYVLPRALWPPAPVAVGQPDLTAPAAAARAPTEDGVTAAHGGDGEAAGLLETAVAAAGAAVCDKVTPQASASLSVATPALADERQAPPPDTTSGSLHCHGKDSDSGSDGMPRRGSRESIHADGSVPDVSRRRQSADSCAKAERAVPDAIRAAGVAEC